MEVCIQLAGFQITFCGSQRAALTLTALPCPIASKLRRKPTVQCHRSTKRAALHCPAVLDESSEYCTSAFRIRFCEACAPLSILRAGLLP